MNENAVNKFFEELRILGYCPEIRVVDVNQQFAIIPQFLIENGRFAGKTVDLGIHALNDYPRMMPASIQIKTNPQLLEKSDSSPGKLNIIDSPLGIDWRYWSFNFNTLTEKSAKALINRINQIFKEV